MTTPIVTTRLNRCRHIIINRPEVRNSLNLATMRQLLSAFEAARDDTDCRVILFYGQGDAAFCSGADLRELHEAASLEQRETFFTLLAQIITVMHSCPQPIVAKIHGFALAGGCGLAAAADITLASDDAQFGLPELKIGLVPMVVMAPIHRAIGRRALLDLVLSAAPITAQRALEINLVTRVHAKHQLDAETQRLVHELSSLAPHAMGVAKKAIYQIPELDYTTLLHDLPKQIARLSLEAEAEEGISAFLNKRSPDWK